MSPALDWSRDRQDWPHARASRFVMARGLRWHVQTMGSGPCLLLVHGTGASTHSWRALLPLLAEHFTVVAIDLPGHGFTQRPAADGLSLDAMAAGLHALLQALDVAPVLAVGHSAGAAILVRLCLDQHIRPGALISVNGALLAFRGMAGRTFPSIAKLLFLNPLVPRLFALGAGRTSRVDKLIRNTGSVLEDEGLSLYSRLFASPDHAGSALGMMARWDLDRLESQLPRLPVPLWLVVGGNDRAVPPSEADRVQALVPGARLITLPGLGHLAHEEAPEKVAEIIFEAGRMQARIA